MYERIENTHTHILFQNWNGERINESIVNQNRTNSTHHIREILESASPASNRSTNDTIDIFNKFNGGEVPHIIIPSIKSKQNKTIINLTTNTYNTITTSSNARTSNTQTTAMSDKNIPVTMPTVLLEKTTIFKLTSNSTVMPEMSTTKTTTTMTPTTMTTTNPTPTVTIVSAKIITALTSTPKNVTLIQPPSVNIFDLISKQLNTPAEIFDVTESIRPIYIRNNEFMTTTQPTTDKIGLVTTEYMPRFLTRIPILPFGFGGITSKTIPSTSLLSHSSLHAQNMPLSTSTQTSKKSMPSKKARRFDFIVYGILPNKTVIRKYPDEIFGRNDDSITEDPAIVYGILSNGTKIRKFPNGTTQIDESKSKSRAFEITDIDVKSLFNPNSDIYAKQWSTERGMRMSAELKSHIIGTAARTDGRIDGRKIPQNHHMIVNASTTSTSPPSNISNKNELHSGHDLWLHGHSGRNVVNIDSTPPVLTKSNQNSTNYFTANNSTIINSATINTTTTNTNNTSLPSTYHNVNITSDAKMVFNLSHTIYYNIYIYIFVFTYNNLYFCIKIQIQYIHIPTFVLTVIYSADINLFRFKIYAIFWDFM